MIYVDLSQVLDRIAAEWNPRAEAATEQLFVEQDPDERRRKIDAGASIWQELKPLLKSSSSGKCWYCEAREIRSDIAVDHFRPKKRVSEDSNHPGYWWLSFVPANFRLSCTFCNSRRLDTASGSAGGKHDQFPLRDGGKRSWGPDDNLDDETPMLLDPCVIDDPEHLWIDDAGQTQVNPASAGHAIAYVSHRVDATRELFHLDHPQLVAARKNVYRDVLDRLRLADKLYLAWKADDDAIKRVAYQHALVDLRNLAVRNAEYSTAARCALIGYSVTSAAAQAVVRLL